MIDGAIAVIATHGLQGASIKEITSTAGLSNGTFYNHFDDREEIIKLAALSVAQEIAADIALMVSDVDDGIGRIVISTNEFIERSVAFPEWGAMIVDATRYLREVRQDVATHLRADIDRAVAQKQLDERPNRLGIHQIVTVIALAIETQLDGGKSRSINRQTCDSVLRLLGLSPAKAAKAVGQYLR